MWRRIVANRGTRAVNATSPPQGARDLLNRAEAAAMDAPVPRRARVLLAAATARRALGDPDGARALGRSVLQMSSSRGLRMISLGARALLAALTSGEEQKTHATVALELAMDFAQSLGPEMKRSFLARPFLVGIAPG